jgi:alcohol dehydrogenase
VVNTSQIHPGSTVAVIGLGGVGLNALLGARVAGARQIVAIDTRDDKLEFARQLGATDAFNAKDEDIVARVKEATGGGVEYAFEMAGSAAALELAWNITGRGGETVSAGLPHPSQRLSIPPVQLVAEERTLRGSYLGSCVPVRDIPNFVQLYRAGQLPVDRLMTEKIRLDEINEAFERLAEGKSVRTVMVP